MMFKFDSFNLINEFKRAFNEPNVEQLASSSVRLQSYKRLKARTAYGIRIESGGFRVVT